MSAFNRAFEHVLGVEGRYSDRAADRGGKTMYGITERVARANGYTGPMQLMPLEVAHRIYRAQYWDIQRLDLVAELSERVALELFDTGVNMGIAVAGQFLQRALNALNHKAEHFADISTDGLIGPMTIAALRAYLERRKRDGGEVVLLNALNGLQACRYVEISERDARQEENTFGWLRQRVHI